VRLVLLAAAAVILLWFLHTIADILVLAAFAVVLAVVISAPVTWLEQRRMPRWLAATVVFLALAAVALALGWLVLPRVAEEASTLAQHLPEYATAVRDRLAALLAPYPDLRDKLPLGPSGAGELIPPFPALLGRLTSVSLSLAAGIAAVLVLAAIVIYAVASPRPLLQLYLSIFPDRHRPRAARAYARASVMLVGWIWSNIVAGALEAVLAFGVLSLLGVPGALVWAALAFFAELVPKVGIYIMSVPPLLVALAVDPVTALWVLLFYVALNEVMGSFVIPRIRQSAMNLHPVSVLFLMLAMAAAFGILGALIATPISAVIKAFFEEFYPPARQWAPRDDALVEAMIRRQVPAVEGAGE